MEVIVKSSPKIEIELATKVVKVGGGGKVTVDSALSATSENPVMNKVVTAELSKKAEKSDIATSDWNASEGEAGFIDNRTHCIDYKNLTDITVDDEKYELSMVEEDGVYVSYARLKQPLLWYGDNYDIVYKKPLHEYGPDINESDLYYDVIRRVTDDWPSPTPPDEGWDAKLEFVNDEYDGHKELVLRSYGMLRGEKLYISGPNGVPIMQIEPHFIPDSIARTEDVDELREETTALWENLDHGTFPNLVAGDLAGRGESVPAEFGFRASGGKSIKDGRAYIKRIKGNSVVWNQLSKNAVSYPNGWCIDGAYAEQERVTYDSDKHILALAGKDDVTSLTVRVLLNIPTNHKVLVSYGVELKTNVERTGAPYLGYFGSPTQWITYGIDISSVTNKEYRVEKIMSLTSDVTHLYIGLYSGSVSPLYVAEDKVNIYSPLIIDLTKMFGAGNEPATIEEFYARVATLGIEDMNAYNEGQVIHCNTESIKSVGDNAWDEEWDFNYINYSTGQPTIGHTGGRICSANFIRVIPFAPYYFLLGGNMSYYVHKYDSDYNWLGEPLIVDSGNTISFDANVAYIKFASSDKYGEGTTYNHDIMITLVHSGWKQDTDAGYQPYWQDILPLPIIRKYFPDGMKSTGTAHDEIRYNKASGKWEYSKSKTGGGKIKSVDMGAFDWKTDGIASGMEGVRYESLTTLYNCVSVPSSELPNILCAKYASVTANDTYRLVTGISLKSAGTLSLADTTIADINALKASLQGVILYYESNDWEWVELDAEDQNFRDYYNVADFGTEQSQSNVPSAAFCADIIYQFNAVDMIREHELEITELQSIIATMQAQLTSLINGGQ